MVNRIAAAVLTLAGSLALISGLLFWTGTALNLMTLHMLLGFLAVGALGNRIGAGLCRKRQLGNRRLRADRWGGHDRHRHDAIIAYGG